MHCLQKTGESIKISDGWDQIKYKDDNIEILLSTIEPGVPFAEHSHKEIQFGFCFTGEFTFIADSERYLIKNGSSYLLNSDVKHKAESKEVFYALDFKKDLPDCISSKIDLMSLSDEKFYKVDYDLKEHEIYCVNGDESSTGDEVFKLSAKSAFIIVSETMSLKINSTEYQLAPMSIYRISDEINDIAVIGSGKVIVIAEKRG